MNSRRGTRDRFTVRVRPLVLIRLVVVIAVVALIAIPTMTVTIGGVYKFRNPILASDFAPRNGFALANLATLHMRLAQIDAPQSAVPRITPQVESLARQARAREPLSARAGAILAIAAEGSRDMARARQNITAALALSRRDNIVNGWMVLDRAKANDSNGAITALNRAMLTHPSTTATYVPILVRVLEEKQAIPLFERMLQTRPSWETEFWRTVEADPKALVNAADVRTRLKRTTPEDLAITRSLLTRLAAVKDYATAERLFNSVHGARDGSSTVANGDFNAQPQWPIFDWELVSTGSLSSSVDTSRRALVIDGLPGASGPVARQLVALKPGRHRITATLAEPFSPTDSRLELWLQCTDGKSLINESIGATTAGFAFEAPLGCPQAWLTIAATAQDSSTTPPALDSVRIQPS